MLAVGKAVLTDLDYGSDFLWRLNDEWLDAWNDPEHPLSNQTLAFSLGGDFIGNDRAMKLFWATCESGSDNTVRISGANLNYTMLEANPDSDPPKITPRVLNRAVPHLILSGYSHFDSETGILHAPDATDTAFKALLLALQTPAAGYDALAEQWHEANVTWMNGKISQTEPGKTGDVNSTVVFNLRNQATDPIGDCMIAFWDEAEISGDPRDVTLPPAAPARSGIRAGRRDGRRAHDTPGGHQCFAELVRSDPANSPIHNDVSIGSYSFYLDYPTWIGDGSHHHAVYIEAVSDSRIHGYKPTIYRPSDDINRLIQPDRKFTVRARHAQPQSGKRVCVLRLVTRPQF